CGRVAVPREGGQHALADLGDVPVGVKEPAAVARGHRGDTRWKVARCGVNGRNTDGNEQQRERGSHLHLLHRGITRGDSLGARAASKLKYEGDPRSASVGT